MAETEQKEAVEQDLSNVAKIRHHTVQEIIHEVRVYIQIVMMKGSCMVWVGTGAANFSSLDVDMMTHMDSVPISSALIGSDADSPGVPLAKRLAMKFGLQAMVSMNLPSAQPLLQAAAEKKVMAEIEGLLASVSQSKSEGKVSEILPSMQRLQT